MKEIRPFDENLATLYCSCPGCKDKLIIRAFKEFIRRDSDNQDFFFEIQYEDPPNLWQRIKRAWDYIKGYKLLWLSHDEILLSTSQIEEMIDVLNKKVEEIRKKEKDQSPG